MRRCEVSPPLPPLLGHTVLTLNLLGNFVFKIGWSESSFEFFRKIMWTSKTWTFWPTQYDENEVQPKWWITLGIYVCHWGVSGENLVIGLEIFLNGSAKSKHLPQPLLALKLEFFCGLPWSTEKINSLVSVDTAGSPSQGVAQLSSRVPLTQQSLVSSDYLLTTCWIKE